MGDNGFADMIKQQLIDSNHALAQKYRAERIEKALAEIIRQHDEGGCISAAAFTAGREALS